MLRSTPLRGGLHMFVMAVMLSVQYQAIATSSGGYARGCQSCICVTTHESRVLA